MNNGLNSAYKKDKIEILRPYHSYALSTNTRNWIDNYYKDPIHAKSDPEDPDVFQLNVNDKKLLEFQLWLEAGKTRPSSLPLNVDVSYNFNMWRNFKRCFIEDGKTEVRSSH